MPENKRTIAQTNQVGQLLRGASEKNLSPQAQQQLQQRLGSCNSVTITRVYTGPAATNACKAMSARAFTIDNALVVMDGISPESSAGINLISHELTHQSNGNQSRGSNATGIDGEERAAVLIEQMVLKSPSQSKTR